ncbi:MAG: hypothetical protein PHV06_08785 [bacterium]|nr:hypothetical protein [bacterium]
MKYRTQERLVLRQRLNVILTAESAEDAEKIYLTAESLKDENLLI